MYVTDNGAYTWQAAVQETVDGTLIRTVSSGELSPLLCASLKHGKHASTSLVKAVPQIYCYCILNPTQRCSASTVYENWIRN